MDVGAVRSSLEGLRVQAERGTPFPAALLRVLGFADGDGARDSKTDGVELLHELGFAEGDGAGEGKSGGEVEPQALVAAVDKALLRLDAEAKKSENAAGLPAEAATRVDLCFVMDCTRSVSGVGVCGFAFGARSRAFLVFLLY